MKKILPLILMLCGCFSALTAQQIPGLHSGLSGMWRIIGMQDSTHDPFLALAFTVVGDTVYGEGDLGVTCSNNHASAGMSLHVKGYLHDDGGILLTSFGESFAEITIRGIAPKDGSSEWTGSVTFTNPSKSHGCIFSDAREFVALRYRSLGGTYVGSIHNGSDGSNLQIALRLTSGEVVCYRPDSASDQFCRTQINASIEVSGDQTYTAKASPTDWAITGPDIMRANGFWVAFRLEDNSTFGLNGHYSNLDGAAMDVAYTTSAGNPPTEKYWSGKLVQQ